MPGNIDVDMSADMAESEIIHSLNWKIVVHQLGYRDWDEYSYTEIA